MSYLVSAKLLSAFGVEHGGVGALPSGWVNMTPPLAWAEGLLTQGHPFPSPSSTTAPLRGLRGSDGSRSRRTGDGGEAAERGERGGWKAGDRMGEELYTSKLNL